MFCSALVTTWVGVTCLAATALAMRDIGPVIYNSKQVFEIDFSARLVRTYLGIMET
jgi:hypothetical protein